METRWTRELLDEAASLVLARRYRSALGRLLVVFDVYPDHPQARQLASELIYLGARTSSEAGPEETLTPPQLFDSRLNSIFCACEAPGCGVSWVSAHHMLDGAGATILNPMGGRCEICELTVCRTHAPSGACPRCGGSLDPAPSPNGRRRSGQTERLNKRLVHVFVLVETKRRLPPDFLPKLFESVVPDVFDDSPLITTDNLRKFTGDGGKFARIYATRLYPAYLTADYDVRVYPGEEVARGGKRWVIVKVFENRPKHLDPDGPPSPR
jgi:hypothetical protein